MTKAASAKKLSRQSARGLDKTVITIQHTGHFWNDLGVIALWRSLSERAPKIERRGAERNPSAVYDGVECVLYPDKLVISGKRTQAYKVLGRAATELRKNVWSRQKSGKFWWSGSATFLYAGQTNPDFLAGYDKLSRKPQWKAKGRCDVCGTTDARVRTTGTRYNPLLVSVQKMSGFYSELKLGYAICQNCAFAAAFALSEAWFSYADQFLSLTLLWPVSGDLFSADRFLRQTSGLRLQGDTTHNYQHAFAYASTPASCFLDLLCSLWRESRSSTSADVLEMAMAGVQFHAMQLSKPNARSNVVSVDRYQVIPDPAGLLRLVQACDCQSQGKVWNALASVLGQMVIRRSDKKYTQLLDEAAHACVAGLPLEDLLEARVYAAIDELQSNRGGTERFRTTPFRVFIPIYFKEVNDMEAQLVLALKSVGESLGQLVKVTDDRGILYSLRNARNADDLLEVLSRVVVRHADSFISGEVELWRNRVREITEGLGPSNWRRVRSLLGIYAGLKLIDMSSKKGESASLTKK